MTTGTEDHWHHEGQTGSETHEAHQDTGREVNDQSDSESHRTDDRQQRECRIDAKAIHHRIAQEAHRHHDEQIRRIPKAGNDHRRAERPVQVHSRPVCHRALAEHVREGNSG